MNDGASLTSSPPPFHPLGRAINAVLMYALNNGDIPPGLKRRIKSHFTVAWRASPELYKEQEILDRLSAPLRTQVCLRQPETPPSQLHLIPSPAPR